MDSRSIAIIAEVLSKKIGEPVCIKTVEMIGSGYDSDGYRITLDSGRHFFIKKSKSHNLSYESAERKVSALLTSNGMAQRGSFGPKPVGVVVVNDEDSGVIPEINEKSEVYHVQEFDYASASYWDLLQQKKNKTKIDEQDLKELSSVVEAAATIHSVKHHYVDAIQKGLVYRDGLRSVINNPELTLNLLSFFPEDSPVMSHKRQKQYVGLMMDVIYEWRNRHDRLRALHGDFWGANLFFREDGTAFIIDYSRIPWGDPGIDIGWWVGQYLWFYHETGNQYFKELGENFLDLYEKRTSDTEIRQAVCLSLGLIGIIYTTPRIHENLDPVLANRFLNTITQSLESNTLKWK